MAVSAGLYILSGISGNVDSISDTTSQEINPYTIRAIADKADFTGNQQDQIEKVVYTFGTDTLTDYAIYDGRFTIGEPLLLTRQDSKTIYDKLKTTMGEDLKGLTVALEDSLPAVHNTLNSKGQVIASKLYYPEPGVTQDVVVTYDTNSIKPKSVIKGAKNKPAMVYTSTYSTLSPAKGSGVTITYTAPAGSPAVKITPICTNNLATFTPSNLSIAPGGGTGTIICKGNVKGLMGIIHSNDAGLGDPLPQVFSSLNEPDYTTAIGMSFTPTLSAGVESTVTLTADKEGFPPGTVINVRLLQGTATISNTTLQPTTGAAQTTFKVTPSGSGLLELDFINNRSLTNPTKIRTVLSRVINWTLGTGSTVTTGGQLSLPANTNQSAVTQALSIADGFEFYVRSSDESIDKTFNLIIARDNSLDPQSWFITTPLPANIYIDFSFSWAHESVTGVNGTREKSSNVNCGAAYTLRGRKVGKDLVLDYTLDGSTWLSATSIANTFSVSGDYYIKAYRTVNYNIYGQVTNKPSIVDLTVL